MKTKKCWLGLLVISNYTTFATWVWKSKVLDDIDIFYIHAGTLST